MNFPRKGAAILIFGCSGSPHSFYSQLIWGGTDFSGSDPKVVLKLDCRWQVFGNSNPKMKHWIFVGIFLNPMIGPVLGFYVECPACGGWLFSATAYVDLSILNNKNNNIIIIIIIVIRPERTGCFLSHVITANPMLTRLTLAGAVPWGDDMIWYAEVVEQSHNHHKECCRAEWCLLLRIYSLLDMYMMQYHQICILVVYLYIYCVYTCACDVVEWKRNGKEMEWIVM